MASCKTEERKKNARCWLPTMEHDSSRACTMSIEFMDFCFMTDGMFPLFPSPSIRLGIHFLDFFRPNSTPFSFM